MPSDETDSRESTPMTDEEEVSGASAESQTSTLTGGDDDSGDARDPETDPADKLKERSAMRAAPPAPQDKAARVPVTNGTAADATPQQASKGNEPTPGSSERPETDGVESKGMSEKVGEILGNVIVVVFFASIALSPVLGRYFGGADRTIDIVASARPIQWTSPDSASWMLQGRALREGEQLQGARVWAIATDERGNRTSPAAKVTDGNGEFELGPIRRAISSDSGFTVTQITVFARAREIQANDTLTFTGEELLRLTPGGGVRWIKLPGIPLFIIFFIFGVSVVFALMRPRKRALLQVQYFTLVALAFMLTVTMISYLSVGVREIAVTGARGEVISLGFASMFHGTYVSEVPSEWLLSLTAPPASLSGTAVVEGFGAPLWVLFMSVIGAALFTVYLILKQIGEPFDVTKQEEARGKVMEIIKHQYYVVFAPFGSIILYQLLVTAGMAKEQVTVAIIMIAAGLALKKVLDKAIEMMEGVFGKTGTDQPNAAGAAAGAVPVK